MSNLSSRIVEIPQMPELQKSALHAGSKGAMLDIPSPDWNASPQCILQDSAMALQPSSSPPCPPQEEESTYPTLLP